MKKYIILAVFALGFVMNVNAQFMEDTKTSRDGFFTPNYNQLREGTGSNVGEMMGIMPDLFGHDLVDNQCAPIGSGLLLLAGMGLAYGIKKSKKD